MNWLKIIGNGGIGFFSTLSGLLTAQTLAELPIPLNVALMAAFIIGGIQTGLSISKEILKESEQVKKEIKRKGFASVCWKTKTAAILENITLF